MPWVAVCCSGAHDFCVAVCCRVLPCVAVRCRVFPRVAVRCHVLPCVAMWCRLIYMIRSAFYNIFVVNSLIGLKLLYQVSGENLHFTTTHCNTLQHTDVPITDLFWHIRWRLTTTHCTLFAQSKEATQTKTHQYNSRFLFPYVVCCNLCCPWDTYYQFLKTLPSIVRRFLHFVLSLGYPLSVCQNSRPFDISVLYVVCCSVCCSVLQCVCCGVLQRAVVCCSALQCVAARCSVLQCVLQCDVVCCSVW